MQHIVAAAACTDMVTGSEFWIPQVLFRPQKLEIFCTSMQYIDAAATCTDMVTGSEIWIPHILFWPQKLVFSVPVCSIYLDAAAACIDMVTGSEIWIPQYSIPELFGCLSPRTSLKSESKNFGL
jgi:hypothetical protein